MPARMEQRVDTELREHIDNLSRAAEASYDREQALAARGKMPGEPGHGGERRVECRGADALIHHAAVDAELHLHPPQVADLHQRAGRTGRACRTADR